MAEETKPRPFVLNGIEYPVPDKFDMGEMMDAERYFGVNFANPAASQMGVLAATMYIAIRRVNPSVTVEDIRAIDPDDLFAAMKASEDDAGPPSPQPPDEKPSGSSEPTGKSSTNGSADLDKIPAATGPPNSETHVG